MLSTSLVLAMATGCTSVEGRFEGHGGTVDDWSMRPNRCTVSQGTLPVHLDNLELNQSFNGLDFYFAGPDAKDTEVVVAEPGSSLQLALVRIPGRNRMAVLSPSTCQVFEVRASATGAEINESDLLEGSVTLDCRHPDLGHVTGQATFRCY